MIPENKDEALARVVDCDVGKWGEAERTASRRLHATKSFGLLLNTLAAHAELAGEEYAELRAAANAHMTATDRRVLNQGG